MKTILFTSTASMIDQIFSALSEVQLAFTPFDLFHLDYGDEGVIIFSTMRKLKNEIAKNCNSNWRKVEVFRNRSGGATVAVK